jgi:Lrp/AsnC family transcriptional regulator for asnA, asnC and gidA
MIRAFVTAKVGSSDYLGATKTIKEKIAKIPRVVKVDIIFGRYDIIAEVEAENLDELSRLVTDQIKSIPNILSTETFICYQP